MPAALASASTLATAPPWPTATGTFAGAAGGAGASGGAVGGGAAAPTESTVVAAATTTPYRTAKRRIPDLPSMTVHAA
ncbi:hypothetical protein GCM10010282_15220 [Streptomyces roseolus]|nr:hypothetical protein GCM10010282_15220 [Streptomyces roseolus]